MIELVLCTALVVYLATRSDLRALVARLGNGRRLFLATLFALIVGGHLAHDGKRTFPFPPWDMYAQPAVGEPTFHEFRMVRASGARETLSAFGDEPRLSGKLQQRLQGLIRVANDTSDAVSAADAGATLDAVLRDLAARHAGDVAGDRPVAVEVWRTTITLRDPQNPAGRRSELVRRIAVR